MPAAQHFFFLELDRGSETLDAVARKCFGYHKFFRTGGMARRFGKSDPKEVPFRVIVSVESEARRNNVAEALLRMRNPLLRLVWISTRAQSEALRRSIYLENSVGRARVCFFRFVRISSARYGGDDAA